MEMIVHNPTEQIYPSSSDYVHALELRNHERLLFVAGTMGLHPTGAAGSTLTEQLELLWTNIRTILTSANMTVDNIVRITSYLRDGSYAGENAAARVAALNGRVVPTTAIIAETLVDDWLVELEIIAAG